MRQQIAKRLRPLADKLVDDIAALVEQQVESAIARVRDAFETALSIAADGAAAELPDVQFPALRAIATPVRVPKPVAHRDIKPAKPDPKPPACSKCGQAGHNARSCGREPRGSRKPDARPMTAIAPSSPRPKPHEVAAAKARIANRGAAKAIAAMRTPRPAEPADEAEDEARWSPQRIAEERELAESRKHAGVMPEPTSTWRVDRGEVAELDFGERE